MSSSLPVVFSLSGTSLTDEEARFFEDHPPFGFILFRRNIDTPEQLQTLTTSLKNITYTGCHILIDQEGGRVQRLNEPHWPQYSCMQDCADEDSLQKTIANISKDLTQAGIDVNCAPVMDVLQPETDISIGDRAFSKHPEIVAKLGTLACQTFLENGITPIIKHLPGHGRAVVDSHKEIPYVTADLETLRHTDFLPFQHVVRELKDQDIWGMVGHCIYNALDPDLPASLSPKVIQEIIRGEIGLSGLLFSDDLSMGALESYGDVAARAKACLQAGCDIALYCHGDLEEMKAIVQRIS